ncbi:MAG: hypothetical protein KGV56_01785, partial [Gammaproteobacteria bacterium]|nr:hypothetical protein [Gammaproteobacteria bacterium]
MANIEDKNKWEEVYEIATTDPVMGGKNGVTNKPLQQLANRTKYLKEQLETTQQNTDSELDRKVSKSGDTMTGDLNLGNHKLKFNNDVSIGCENDNLYIREPEDTADSGGKEWLRIEDDNAAFIFGNRILTENDVSSSVSSTSTTDLASSKAAKTAYDKAVDAKTVADNAKSSADGKVSKSGDTMTGDLNLGNHKLKFNNDVSIGCENDNLYIREPEDTA